MSGLVLKYRNGECIVIRRSYEAALPLTSRFLLTLPKVPKKSAIASIAIDKRVTLVQMSDKKSLSKSPYLDPQARASDIQD